MSRRLLSLGAFLCLCVPATAAAQGRLDGRLLEPRTNRPIACVQVMLLDNRGALVDSAITPPGGRFSFPVPSTGLYQLAFLTSRTPPKTEPLALSADTVAALNFRVRLEDHSLPYAGTGPDGQPPRFAFDPESPRVRYPVELDGEVGETIIAFGVDSTGRVDTSTVVPLAGTDPLFLREALRTLPRTRFVITNRPPSRACFLLVQRFVFQR